MRNTPGTELEEPSMRIDRSAIVINLASQDVDNAHEESNAEPLVSRAPHVRRRYQSARVFRVTNIYLTSSERA